MRFSVFYLWCDQNYPIQIEKKTEINLPRGPSGPGGPIGPLSPYIKIQILIKQNG